MRSHWFGAAVHVDTYPLAIVNVGTRLIKGRLRIRENVPGAASLVVDMNLKQRCLDVGSLAQSVSFISTPIPLQVAIDAAALLTE